MFASVSCFQILLALYADNLFFYFLSYDGKKAVVFKLKRNNISTWFCRNFSTPQFLRKISKINIWEDFICGWWDMSIIWRCQTIRRKINHGRTSLQDDPKVFRSSPITDLVWQSRDFNRYQGRPVWYYDHHDFIINYSIPSWRKISTNDLWRDFSCDW